MVFESYIDPVLRPLLGFPILWVILIVSFVISVIITLAYKFFTDQKMMKEVRGEIKGMQKEMKEFRNDVAKVSHINKQMMQKQMKLMMQSLKVTIYTLIPLIIVFSWLNASLAYEPLRPDEPFTVTAFSGADINLSSTPNLEILNKEQLGDKTVWILSGSEGRYTLWYELGSETRSNDIIITNKQDYEPPTINFKNSRLEMVEIGNMRTHPFGDFRLFGWQPGWLAAYILFSLVFSLGMRKLMKVH